MLNPTNKNKFMELDSPCFFLHFLPCSTIKAANKPPTSPPKRLLGSGSLKHETLKPYFKIYKINKIIKVDKLDKIDNI